MLVTSLFVWSPRVLGLGMSLFLALFAFDAFQGAPFHETAVALAVHLLPALLVLALVAAAWKWEWLGALGFIGLAVLYAAIAHARPDWILVISGPMLVIGLLLLWSWRLRRNHSMLTR